MIIHPGLARALAAAFLLLSLPLWPAHAQTLTAVDQTIEPMSPGAHRSPYAEFLFIRDARVEHGGASVLFLVSINEEGRVTDAVAQEGDMDFAAEAGRAIRRGSYKPFIQGGVPVAVKVQEWVRVLPLERWGQGRAFPEAPAEAVEIRLERSACFGFCPAYSLTIGGDGRVVFNGDAHTSVRGEVAYRIDRQAVAALVEQFRAADFFSLEDSYASDVTDIPGTHLSLRIGDRVKRVFDYGGLTVGMPLAVPRLAEAVDRLAGSARWTDGRGGDLVRNLRMIAWDFHSDNAATALACAAGRGDSAMILALLAEGVKATGTCDGRPALLAAAQAGEAAVVRRLISAGAARDLDGKDKSQALLGAVWSGNLATVEVILTLDPDLEIRGAEDRTALMLAADEASAQRLADNDRADLPGIVQTLLGHGANPGARGDNGETSLHLTDDPAIAQALIDASANIEARDNQNCTPLLTVFSEEVALVLLKAGADPKAKGSNGQDITERAGELGWERVLKLLPTAP